MTAPLPAPPPGGLIALDGYLDDQTLPDDVSGESVRFQLVVSPTEDRVDELVMPCTVATPQLAHAVLHDLGASDVLRVSGHLQFPQEPGDVLLLQVSAIHVLDSGVDLSQVGSEDDLGPELLAEYGFIDRYGDYQVWHDPDTCLTSVWHAFGKWVDSTDDPSTLGDLIAEHQQRTTSAPDSAHPEPAPVTLSSPSKRRLAGPLHRMRNWLRLP
ncbi:hypothetical protein FE633_13275 [Streptomyces montanus]|uniref:Uncharacterized protein n=1 Tax=Streptomyces montanus TaxID=2580423 RepID=A0A5R9FY46_9ACTN|nr:hypothetical protein [Streptomyces montanus]TLS45733.1 hypothetical protein FE633_13275 [Streptomyces montanus]